MATAQEIYASQVSLLAPSEQLRLATLILDELTKTAASKLDFSDEWSDQDLHDLAAFSLQHSVKSIGEE
jgi:hypothetical protein